MSTTSALRSPSAVRIVGLISIVAGLVLIVAGAVTWGLVRTQLVDENITVAEDAAAFGGQLVDGPLEAYYQADIINHHALDGSGGKTYAEMDREDPARATMMNASFLRASLFTSVIAFGVAAFAMGLGLLFVLVGWSMHVLGGRAVGAAPVTKTPVTATA